MKKRDKRGLSAVIAAVLMILLVIIAIGIIWYAIRGMLTNVSEEIQTGTSKVVLNIVDDSVKPVLDDSGSAISFKISRDIGEGELSKIRFVLESDEKKNVELPAENFNQLDEKTFSVPLGEAVFLKSISIAPIVKSESGKESLGYVTDTYKFTDKEQRLFFKNYGLVSWWSMDDNVLDEVGNNNCKFVGNSRYGKGIINNAVDFDGNNYLNCSNNIGNFGTGEFSIGLWILFPIRGSSSWEGIISKGFTTSAPANTWGIVRNYNKTNSVKFQDALTVTPPALPAFNDDLDSGIISNDWHYISVTRQAKNVSLYVDGKVVSSSEESTITPLTNSADLKIGSWRNDRSFKGKIDEVMIFNKSISEDKIKALYSFGFSE